MKRKALKERVEKISGYKLCKEGLKIDHCRAKQALELLPSLRKAVGGKGGKIYCQVNSVSKSGMSRTISVFIVHKGDIINLNYTPFWKIYGDSKRNGVVRIKGCGMDMLFEATYRLYCFLFSSKRPYQKHLNQYRSL